MDKKVDWKKTNTKSITVDGSHSFIRGLAVPPGNGVDQWGELELEKVILSNSDEKTMTFLMKS